MAAFGGEKSSAASAAGVAESSGESEAARAPKKGGRNKGVGARIAGKG